MGCEAEQGLRSADGAIRDYGIDPCKVCVGSPLTNFATIGRVQDLHNICAAIAQSMQAHYVSLDWEEMACRDPLNLRPH
jgi:hypothetical protein